ncbi:hypothetical protein E4U55_004746 [Claviceps digitariae]|nr:hypothetical protein E4U55_004746 [Claviceps digitariae]
MAMPQLFSLQDLNVAISTLPAPDTPTPSTSPSSLSSAGSWETKRKLQNREAQRRYRQRIKRRQVAFSEHIPEHIFAPCFANGELHQDLGNTINDSLQPHSNDLLEPLDISRGLSSHNDTKNDAIFSFCLRTETNCWNQSEIRATSESNLRQWNEKLPFKLDFELQDSQWVPVPSVTLENTRTFAGRRHSSTESTHNTSLNGKSRSHEKIIAKASGMIEELQSLYKFGVDLELLVDDGNVDTCLRRLDQLFQKSSQQARVYGIDARDSGGGSMCCNES